MRELANALYIPAFASLPQPAPDAVPTGMDRGRLSHNRGFCRGGFGEKICGGPDTASPVAPKDRAFDTAQRCKNSGWNELISLLRMLNGQR